MYFWNIESLKSDIVAERLAEKDRFKYALIYIVFNIIEQKLSGHIDISSQEDEGVTCIITLPILLTTS